MRGPALPTTPLLADVDLGDTDVDGDDTAIPFDTMVAHAMDGFNFDRDTAERMCLSYLASLVGHA